VTQNLAQSGSTLLKMLLVLIGFVAIIAYSTVAFTARDPLWFTSGFQEKPYRVVVYNAGQATEYWSGQPGYDQLAEAVRQSLDSGVAHQAGVGLSSESLQEAYKKYLTVEAFFIKPVKLHAGYNTGNPTQMLFLITGRHSELSPAFLGDQKGYWVNPPALKNLQPLREALKKLGYTVD
jgi:hypothetical protein